MLGQAVPSHWMGTLMGLLAAAGAAVAQVVPDETFGSDRSAANPEAISPAQCQEWWQIKSFLDTLRALVWAGEAAKAVRVGCKA